MHCRSVPSVGRHVLLRVPQRLPPSKAALPARPRPLALLARPTHAAQVALLSRSVRIVGAVDTPGLGCHTIAMEGFAGGCGAWVGERLAHRGAVHLSGLAAAAHPMRTQQCRATAGCWPAVPAAPAPPGTCLRPGLEANCRTLTTRLQLTAPRA